MIFWKQKKKNKKPIKSIVIKTKKIWLSLYHIILMGLWVMIAYDLAGLFKHFVHGKQIAPNAQLVYILSLCITILLLLALFYLWRPDQLNAKQLSRFALGMFLFTITFIIMMAVLWQTQDKGLNLIYHYLYMLATLVIYYITFSMIYYKSEKNKSQQKNCSK